MDPPGPEQVLGLPERGHHPGQAPEQALLPQGHQPPSWHKDQPERHPVPERAQRPAREPGPHPGQEQRPAREPGPHPGQEQHLAREPGPHPGLAQEPASWHKDQRVPVPRPVLERLPASEPEPEPVPVRLRERALGLAPPREPELRRVRVRCLRHQAY